ncbi:uncharacterized protein YpmS [Anoxybacillus tepidamans]|uniref:Uncharacterized protein YpmS n=1 Tax=Anoxybacteroides tepidamans TaxID=265948 RepID=A0A7W8MWS1_9BACL|nr:YpmS family protein [Anoxybacillus tepidamans]MBB5325661.1 uncharacterized protein YpmS [Anoxybacillus tepidamans]
MKWKIAFFALLTVNIVAVSALFFLIFQPSKQTVPAPETAKGATFLVYSSKEDMSVIINDYIQKKMKKQSLPYRVWISDRVHLASKFLIFGREVDVTVSFVPKVVNGDLELGDPDLSLGELRIPVEYALKYLQKYANLPEEVIIDPENTRIYVALTNIHFKNGYRISAKEFDLQRDNIVFTLTVPIK